MFGSGIYSEHSNSQFGGKGHDHSGVLGHARKFEAATQVCTAAAPSTFFGSTADHSSDHDSPQMDFTVP